MADRGAGAFDDLVLGLRDRIAAYQIKSSRDPEPEQAAYEARRAEKRYKPVDPDNRVVARTLEREWESKLRELEEVERQYTEARPPTGGAGISVDARPVRLDPVRFPVSATAQEVVAPRATLSA